MGGAFPYLIVIVLIPAGAAVVVGCLPAGSRRAIQAVGALATLATLGFAAAMTVAFRTGDGHYQMVIAYPWIHQLGISFTLGVDGISLFLVLLSAVLFPIALVAMPSRAAPKSFVAWLLLLETACIGSFLALDVLLFFLFFELTLIPVYFLIAEFGHARRGYAATKFFLYTFAASALLLVGILALVGIHERETHVTTFAVQALAHTHLSGTAGVLLLLAFTAAFAVKAPIFPFHTWSPDAYGEAPASGSIVLAGVMAKLGTYGIIRFDLTLFPHAVVTLAPLFLTLGVIGIIYGGVVAAVQRDVKRLVAYSSLAHLGFIVVGAFALSEEALSGAVLQMVNHGIYTAGLFLLIAMIYRRSGTFQLPLLGGLQRRAPVMAAVFVVVVLASIGVPGLNGFVGEFLILAGTFVTHRWWAVVAVAGVVIAAVYLLWAYQQIFHGKESDSEAVRTRSFPDLSWRERAIMAPLVVLIVFLGIYPRPVLDRITPSVDLLLRPLQLAAHPPAASSVADLKLRDGREPHRGVVTTAPGSSRPAPAHSSVVAFVDAADVVLSGAPGGSEARGGLASAPRYGRASRDHLWSGAGGSRR
jgi:NADH-quinone oxidoreductase subunit M